MNPLWPRLKPWLGLTSVLLVGVLLGAVVTAGVMQKHLRAFLRDGPPRRSGEIIVSRLSRELDLSAAQRDEILQILRDYEPKFRQINKSKKLASQNAFEELRQQIRACLTPAQQPRYDALIERLRKHNSGHEDAKAQRNFLQGEHGVHGGFKK
ncbi:MAG: hypothetical protein LBK71_03910 [Verrucomicrobiales bacterium]|jgi:hypothetical protein|nr:hypothetical protein [Verrucomicrobiales bacterium]